MGTICILFGLIIFLGSILGGFALTNYLVTVSYTHLDVYKRQLVFHYGMHARYQLTSPNPWNLIAKVPEGADVRLIPMVRMATIAFTSIRVSDIQLGDVVVVSGLGLVGIMAA